MARAKHVFHLAQNSAESATSTTVTDEACAGYRAFTIGLSPFSAVSLRSADIQVLAVPRSSQPFNRSRFRFHVYYEIVGVRLPVVVVLSALIHCVPAGFRM